jgi:dolichyl-phosphate-mannose--protein O-mannosyl transferase
MVVALMGWYLIQKEILAWYFVFFIFIVPVPGLWQLAAWQRRGESLEVITNKLHSNT